METQLFSRLEEHQGIREKKELLNSLQTVDDCVSRLEGWLSSIPENPTVSGPYILDNSRNTVQLKRKLNGTHSLGEKEMFVDANLDEESVTCWPNDFFADCSLHEDSGQRIDRVANEFIKLQFLEKKCQEHPVLLSFRPRIQWITSVLHELLEGRLQLAFEMCRLTASAERPSVNKQAGAKLRQVLSTYLIIDRLPDVIECYRRNVLRPKLSQIFVPKPELGSKGSDTTEVVRLLNEMYAAALHVLDLQLDVFTQLRFQCSSETYDPLGEFDCVADGFWPETVDLLCSNLDEMFAPGDPDRFYALYTSSLKFVNTLESKLNSSKAVSELRNRTSYSKFMNKWSLPVYFQIRFQDIASRLESEINQGLKLALAPSTNACLTTVTQLVIAQLERCWQDGIYVVSLRHRFWKLTLQLLSRYCTFVTHQSTVCQNPDNSTSIPVPSAEFLKPTLYLLVDCHQLTTYVRVILLSRITAKLGPIGPLVSDNQSTSDSAPVWLTDCLDEMCKSIDQAAKSLQTMIVDQLLRACLSVSRQVLDVPRQYRRTNRSLPVASSVYVSAMVSPLSDLGHLCEDAVHHAPDSTASLEQLISCAIIRLSLAYQGQLHELLSSVKKTEDSLRKLREARLGANHTNQALASNSSGTYSDDDKIRHQLYLDACGFRDLSEHLWGLDKEAIETLGETVKMVEVAKNEAGSNCA
ncbi:Oligomeric Golgi complex subunit 2 [Fasciolopsis buskii]|uniref:Oligomeric Golgi complex subunit 2 n=1 Tax=Fasciolopsis buskii TaxID=27845 RepID=A0A8E0VIZ6_9TREM|nr:Oligomeric Golgi complex subunit 2 [Fasciolopsis buski]